ncbi:MAG: energy transducer TonB [Bacteroidetes bacterium HGW-Bacteroidetes-21]|nr:MAG: energy transducer TonB [Bacteroidetes bacterium HGW-Bacteroidetes-21]
METKKSPKANLEKYRLIFMQTGLIITLAVIFTAFEWKGSSNYENLLGDMDKFIIEDEMIPITKPEVEKKLPPPPKVVEIIEIVKNDQKVDDLKVPETEMENKTEVKPIELAAEKEDDEIVNFYIIEEKPEFPGGNDAALSKWIAENTRYPQTAKELEISGKVYIQFIIDKEGNITEAEVIRSVDPLLDKEALRVINSMPKWKPGKQRSKAVKVSFQIPIKFILE